MMRGARPLLFWVLPIDYRPGAILTEESGATSPTPTEMACLECQGRANLMSFAPDEGFAPGDVVAYVCEDCGHRYDVVVPESDETP